MAKFVFPILLIVLCLGNDTSSPSIQLSLRIKHALCLCLIYLPFATSHKDSVWVLKNLSNLDAIRVPYGVMSADIFMWSVIFGGFIGIGIGFVCSMAALRWWNSRRWLLIVLPLVYIQSSFGFFAGFNKNQSSWNGTSVRNLVITLIVVAIPYALILKFYLSQKNSKALFRLRPRKL